MKQLERILFLQGNRCFFCAQPIPDGEASVEHLVAVSNGGQNDGDNCVVCCKSVNAALSNLSIKSKLRTILDHRGAFSCPASHFRISVAPPLAEALLPGQEDQLKLVIADLVKRGTSRPRKVLTLKNTMNAVFQMQLPEIEIDGLVVELQRRGYITIQDTKVSYALAAKFE